MEQIRSLILEYVKFSTTFVLLEFSAGAWLLERELKSSRKFRCYHLILFLGLITTSVSVVELICMMKEAVVQTAIKDGNLLSDQMQDSLAVATYSIYIGAALYWLFVITQRIFYREGKKEE